MPNELEKSTRQIIDALGAKALRAWIKLPVEEQARIADVVRVMLAQKPKDSPPRGARAQTRTKP